MRKILLLSTAVVFLLSCGNSQSSTNTGANPDTTTARKDSANNTPGSNTVTPPASNGQY